MICDHLDHVGNHLQLSAPDVADFGGISDKHALSCDTQSMFERLYNFLRCPFGLPEATDGPHIPHLAARLQITLQPDRSLSSQPEGHGCFLLLSSILSESRCIICATISTV